MPYKSPERKKEHNRYFRKTHAEYYKKYYLINKAKYNTPFQKKKRRQRDVKLRLSVLEKYGSKCVKCGFSDSRALQIDHVNGGGHAELKGVHKKARRTWYLMFLKNKKARKKNGSDFNESPS